MPEKIQHKISEIAHRIAPSGIITKINQGEVFVFGSNLGGKHSKFAAKTAMSFGAKFGQAAGIQGNSYGIPTKDKSVRRVLSIKEIKSYVDDFILFAGQHLEMVFIVTEIGCGASNYKPKDIAPLFEGVIDLENVHFTERFWHKLGFVND